MKNLIFFLILFIASLSTKWLLVDAKNILMLAHNKYYSHFALKVRMANLLVTKHKVHFYFVDHTKGDWDAQLKVEKFDRRVKLNPIPVDEALWEKYFPKPPASEVPKKVVFNDWNTPVKSSVQPNYWNLMEYSAQAIFKEMCIDNPRKYCTNEMGRRFDLGIAENRDLGAHAVFHKIGLANTIATTATPALPAFLHFLGLLQLPPNNEWSGVPEHYSGGRHLNGQALSSEENAAEYVRSIGKLKEIYEAEAVTRFYAEQNIPPVIELFKSAKRFLVNTPNFALTRITRPDDDPRIKFIGGIAVDIELFPGQKTIRKQVAKPKDAPQEAVELMNEMGCAVLFSLGSLVSFDSIRHEALQAIFNTFSHFPNCAFIMRIPGDELEAKMQEGHLNVPQNVRIVDWMPQQQWLAQYGGIIRVLIIHCGQNSLNEAFYAGIPVICIPFFGDQRFNGATIDKIDFGSWVNHNNVHNELDGSLLPFFPEIIKNLNLKTITKETLIQQLIIQQNAKKIRAKLQNENPELHFLQIIDEALSPGPSAGPTSSASGPSAGQHRAF